MKTLFTLMLTLIVLFAFGCKSDTAEQDTASQEAATAEATETTATDEPEMLTKPSGVRYQELVMGEGVEAVNGMHLECHYTLWLGGESGTAKGDKIDSSVDRGQPFQCTLGQGLIEGWTDGMIGMKAGGKRIIYVPWEMGYGERRAGGRIPPRSNLIFEIEFIKPL
jgi:peptidylprolyl isomerase